MTSSNQPFPPHFFERIDESTDADFDREPRFVKHVGTATIEALTQVYRELIAPGSRVLDLMSSWISHLPHEVETSAWPGSG